MSMEKAKVTARNRFRKAPIYDVRLPDGREVRNLTLQEVARLGLHEPSVARRLTSLPIERNE